MKSRGFCRIRTTLCGAVAWLTFSNACQAEEIHWGAAVSGNWTDSLRWSPQVIPANSGDLTYDVILDAGPAAHDVRFASTSAITVDSVRLTSSGSRLVLDNATASLTFVNELRLDAGAVQLRAGTLTVPTIVGGAGVIELTGGTLASGCTLDGTAILTRQSVGAVVRGLTFGTSGRIEFRGTDAYHTQKQVRLTFDGTQVLGGSGVVVFDDPSPSATYGYPQLFAGSGQLTIGPDLTILTGTGSGTVSGGNGSLLNKGTIWARTAGATLSLSGTWRNEGTLKLDAGRLLLNGTYSTADIGALVRTGGQLALGGTFTNTSSTFQVNAATGDVESSARIKGGTISIRDGKTFRLGGIIEDLTLDGQSATNGSLMVRNLSLAPGTVLSIANPFTIGPVATNEAQILAGSGQIVFDGTSEQLIEGALARLTIAPNVKLRNGSANGKVRAQYGLFNQGAIEASGAGKTLQIQESNVWTFVNTGTLRASNGATLAVGGLIPAGGLGAFDSTGGSVKITGKLLNTGTTLELVGPSNTLQLSGEISGGSVRTRDGAQLLLMGTNSPLLRGVDFEGEAVVPAVGGANPVNVPADTALRGRLRILGGASVNFLGAPPSDLEMIAEGGTTFVAASPSANPLNFPPEFAFRNTGGIANLGTNVNSKLTNSGQLILEAAGKEMYLNGSTVRNEGLLRCATGLLYTRYPFVNTGTIEVTGGEFQLFDNRSSGSGVIRLTGGKLTLKGTAAPEFFSNLEHNGGLLSVSGTLENTGRTISLAPNKPWLLSGTGTIIGGEIVSESGGRLDCTGTPTLRGVDLRGNVRVSAVYASDGLSLVDRTSAGGGQITLTNSAKLKVLWSGTFDGQEVVLGGESEVAGSLPELTQIGGESTGSVLTLGPGSVVRNGGGDGRVITQTLGLINQGVISARNARRLDVWTATFDQQGTLEARGGSRIYVESRTQVLNLTDGTPTSNKSLLKATLRGGKWAAYDNSILQLGVSTILRNEADVLLDGPGSRFYPIEAMETNAGVFSLDRWNDLTTLTSLANSGNIRLGIGADLLVQGDFNCEPTSLLQFALAGSPQDPAEMFGAMTASGIVLLDGALAIDLSPSYVPQLGDTFTLVSAASVLGGFDDISLPSLVGGLTFELQQTTQELRLTVVPEPSVIALAVPATFMLLRRRPRPRPEHQRHHHEPKS